MSYEMLYDLSVISTCVNEKTGVLEPTPAEADRLMDIGLSYGRSGFIKQPFLGRYLDVIG